MARTLLALLVMLIALGVWSCKGDMAQKPAADGTSTTAASAKTAAGASPSGTAAADSTPFAALMKRRCLAFEEVEDYAPIKVENNAVWHHLHARRSSRQPVEIRYGAPSSAVDKRIVGLCKGKECPLAPSKDTIRSILKDAFAPLAKEGAVERIREFPLYAVRGEFNANWGGVASFDVNPKLAPEGRAVAVLIHRIGCGTAMFVGLYQAHSRAIEDEWMRAFHSLKFDRPIGEPDSRALSKPLVGKTWRCGEEGFVQMRFSDSTWTIIHISVAMAAMGPARPYETIIHDVTYQPGERFSARIFRVDNMEQGDRTPADAKPQLFRYQQKGDTLTVTPQSGGKSWDCKLR